MKKILLTLAVLCAVSSFGKTGEELFAEVHALDRSVRAEWWEGRSTEDVRAMADYVLAVAATNHKAACAIQGYVSRSLFRHWSLLPGHELAEEYDPKFAAADICNGTIYWKLAPICTRAFLSSTNHAAYVASHPAWVTHIRGMMEGGGAKVAPAQVANCALESSASLNTFYNYNSLDYMKKRLVGGASKIVRHALRKRGRPITTQNGVNPIQDAVDSLTTALNAPKMAGVKEWYAEWCPEYTWIDVRFDDSEMAKLKDDVFYGDVMFSNSAKFRLCVYLGLEEYNRFVKQFNCEKE